MPQDQTKQKESIAKDEEFVPQEEQDDESSIDRAESFLFSYTRYSHLFLFFYTEQVSKEERKKEASSLLQELNIPVEVCFVCLLYYLHALFEN
jgi:hypothetical protein